MPKNSVEKQFTLDKLPQATPKDAIDIIKQPEEEPITVTQIQYTVKEDELELKIAFKLPLKKSFSRAQSNIFFDNELVATMLVRMLRGPLATVESEFSALLHAWDISRTTHNRR